MLANATTAIPTTSTSFPLDRPSFDRPSFDQASRDRAEFPAYARMFAALHDAMRRDARRLVEAVDAASRHGDGPPNLPALARWFDRFEAVIEHHHRCEDEIVWPGLEVIIARGGCGDEGAAFLAARRPLLDDHEELDRAMHAVRRSLLRTSTDRDRWDAALRFEACLDVHLASEEAALFPLLLVRVREEDYLELEEAVVKATPFTALTFTLPWVLETASDEVTAEILTGLPLPIRLAHRWALQGRYRRIVAAATGVGA